MSVRPWWVWGLGLIGVAIGVLLAVIAFALLSGDGGTSTELAQIGKTPTPGPSPTMPATPPLVPTPTPTPRAPTPTPTQEATPSPEPVVGEPSPTAAVELQGLTPERAYGRVAEAIRRPGFVLHSTLRTVGPTDEGGQAPFYTKEFWLDAERQALREHFRLDPSRESYDVAEEGVIIVVGTHTYVPDDPGEALRFDAEGFCPGTTDAIVSQLFECGGEFSGVGSPDFERAPSPRIETDAEYKGQAAIALVLDTGEHPASGENPATVHVYLDRESFLPLARVVGWYDNGSGEPSATYVSEYEHEFISADALSGDFLDPRSIGYGAENEDALLAEIASEVPVYWLGDEFEPEGDLEPLVLTRITTSKELGQDPGPLGTYFGGLSGWLYYETPNGVPGVNILLWQREEWETFMQTEAGRFLSDASCAQRMEMELDSARAVVYVLSPLDYPLSLEALGACEGRVSVVPLTDPTVIAFVDQGDVVLDVRSEVVGYYDSLEAVEVVLKGLRPR
jgi:hypothetical protein